MIPPFSTQAQDALTRLALGKVVRVERMKDESAVLYLPDNVSLNEELLRLGFAQHTLGGSAPEYARYAALMQAAQKQKLGIWGGQGATPEDAAIRRIIEAVERESAMEAGIAAGTATLSAAAKFGDGTLAGKVEARVMETNSTWWKYAWKVTLTNRGKAARSVVAVVEFQDEDGFPIEQSPGEATTVPSGDEVVLTGFP